MNIKKGLHKIRHTRPQWYKDYHEWEPHTILHWTAFIISSIIILIGLINIVSQLQVRKVGAATSSTTLNQDVNSGTLTISNTGNKTLSTGNVSINSQNTTGSLGTISVVDDRGTGVGWSVTATSTDFYVFNSPVKISGSNNTLSVNTSATYDSSTEGTYTITIVSNGAAGVATFDVSGLETASGVTTGSGIAVGTHGLVVDFADATYATGNSWQIRVDTIPVTGLRVTPGSLTTISGSDTSVTAGSLHTFTDTADATALITASSGYGLGSYSVTPSLQLTIPANSYANSYTATVVETVL